MLQITLKAGAIPADNKLLGGYTVKSELTSEEKTALKWWNSLSINEQNIYAESVHGILALYTPYNLSAIAKVWKAKTNQEATA
jgi:hypothetical protein